MLARTALALAGLATVYAADWPSEFAPSPDPLLSTLVVVPLDHASSLPLCANYHASVGTTTRYGVYTLTPECYSDYDQDSLQPDHLLLFGAPVLDVQLDGLNLSAPVNYNAALSTLVHLHRTAVEEPSSFSSSSSSSGRTQIHFDAPSTPLSAAAESARLSNPEHNLFVTPLGLSPLAYDTQPTDDFLLFLDRDGPTALKQLEVLSSHPTYAAYSVVSIPHTGRPLSSLNAESRFPEVPKKAVNRVRAHLDGLRFSPAISRVLGTVDEKLSKWRLRDDVEMLSGENQEGLREEEKWVSRHSMSEGAPKAAAWLAQKMSAYSFTCTPHQFLPSFAPMLECVYVNSGLGDQVLAEDGYRRDERVAAQALRDGEGMKYGKNETVILAAHYDSRGTFGSLTAPGADDDASGTALVLAVARAIASSSVRFSRKVVFCLFAGEEQGLLGSQYYAKKLAGRTVRGGEEGEGGEGEREDVAMMLQVDMVGYRKEGEPMQLARPDVIGLPEAGWLVGNLSEIYVPELVTGYTPACCSDHQMFVEQAFPASWIFERNGPIADPCYHSSCDLSARPGYSFDQIGAHVKVALAYVLELGGWAYL
ncbi:hypothetical protein JCM8097_008875 [Rhodosporidiobolus ruineniae]